jgi:RHS repeat-associated protein
MRDNRTVNLFGQKATMFYDPRGQVIRTVNPDGSQQRVIYGVPADLTTPDVFAPTPWEAYTYDANDLAPLSTSPDDTSLSERAPQTHHYTPASIEIDALGRTVNSVERNGIDPITEWYATRSTYDIRGNVLTVTDALGREAFRYFYDLANRPLRTENIDAGVRRIVLDALGNEIERRDSKGALLLRAYDVLNRPIRLWARDGLGQTMTLREQIEYGDGGTPEQPEPERAAHRSLNRLGKLYRHYDEAGLLAFPAYDFKGNVLEKTRQVIGDESILAIFDSPPADWQISAFRVNWQPDGTTLEDHAATLLDPTLYETSFTYDALNRMRLMRYPQNVDGGRKELRPAYNRAGALESVALDGATYVERIAYNAKGQRLFIAYGNGVMTRYAYDPHTFRLTRLCTERFSNPEELTYRPNGGLLQDFAYEYDLVGNITDIHDRTPESGIPNSLFGVDALDRTFDYDPLYRLRSATGREHALGPPDPPWIDTIKTQDANLTRGYTQTYQYDRVGNITEMQHQASEGNYIRTFAIVPNRNQLATLSIGQTTYGYTYDTNGNLIRETTSRHFEWDHNDHMRVFRNQTNGSAPTVHAHYLYDAAGQRVKKLVRKQNGHPVEVTTYIDGVFEHHWVTQAGVTRENNSLHVMDDKQRIALVRVGVPFADDSTLAVKYHLGDHLGSSTIVIGGDIAAANDFINREEFLPYGETSFGSFARKRFRFTGKDRDEESGLNYHGARQYAPWLGRWANCDPAGMAGGISGYVFVRGNPVAFVDPGGAQREPSDASSSNVRLADNLASRHPFLGSLRLDISGGEQRKELLTQTVRAHAFLHAFPSSDLSPSGLEAQLEDPLTDYWKPQEGPVVPVPPPRDVLWELSIVEGSFLGGVFFGNALDVGWDIKHALAFGAFGNVAFNGISLAGGTGSASREVSRRIPHFEEFGEVGPAEIPRAPSTTAPPAAPDSWIRFALSREQAAAFADAEARIDLGAIFSPAPAGVNWQLKWGVAFRNDPSTNQPLPPFPPATLGYYREHYVLLPGQTNPGRLRIVTAGWERERIYRSFAHYESFYRSR